MIALSEREQILQWIEEARGQGARLSKACQLLGISPRTLQRWRESDQLQSDGRTRREFSPDNKLSERERQQILAVANSNEFAHLPPSQIVPILAERGIFIASESTFYRVLRDAKQLAHRQASRPAGDSRRPKALQASGPNQLYSWDITYLPSGVKGAFFYLYLFMDVYSRKIVGWQVYDHESSEWAAELMCDIARRENIDPGQVTLHSDNGGPMKGATMLATLQRLGVVPSFSRPSVSNDNPFSESLFRTLKYRPDYPSQSFGDLQAARQWVEGFVAWYNHEHRHSAIKFVTPAQRHAGQDAAILASRDATYQQAKAQRPQRWSGQTRDWSPIPAVYLNPGKSNDKYTTGENHKKAA